MTSSLSRHVGTRNAEIPSAGLGGAIRATNSASGFIKAIESGS
ncbi:MAG TPA: hypothetical protein VGW09_03205 [Nitrososphaeraceae archaeon]|nr:hypothetical protein [Nitrososphaeraceae archaeon]